MFQSKKRYYSDELKLRVIGSLVFSTFKYKKIKAILLWHLQEHYSFVLGLKIHRIANGLFTRTLLPFRKHLLLNQSVSFKTKFAYIFYLEIFKIILCIFELFENALVIKPELGNTGLLIWELTSRMYILLGLQQATI